MNEDRMTYLEAKSKVLKALGHPTRLMIAEELGRGERDIGGEGEAGGHGSAVVGHQRRCHGVLDPERGDLRDALGHFREMLRIRRFEDRCVELYSATKIRGFLHLYIGEEAVAAGALAALYTEMGGESLYFGKPHPPVYDLARQRLTQAAGRAIPDSRILAIGDGIRTDIEGALGEDIDSLFVTGGLAREETGTDGEVDAAMLEAFIGREMIAPTFAIAALR